MQVANQAAKTVFWKFGKGTKKLIMNLIPFAQCFGTQDVD
jgi:hypothetical protein